MKTSVALLIWRSVGTGYSIGKRSRTTASAMHRVCPRSALSRARVDNSSVAIGSTIGPKRRLTNGCSVDASAADGKLSLPDFVTSVADTCPGGSARFLRTTVSKGSARTYSWSIGATTEPIRGRCILGGNCWHEWLRGRDVGRERQPLSNILCTPRVSWAAESMCLAYRVESNSATMTTLAGLSTGDLTTWRQRRAVARCLESVSCWC